MGRRRAPQVEGTVCRKVAETAGKPGKVVGAAQSSGLAEWHAESGREMGRVCIL